VHDWLQGPALLYTHLGPVGFPGNMMSMKGILGPQENMMITPQLRPQGMAADRGSHGPGNPENMMFSAAMFVHEDHCQDALRELQEGRLLDM
jgi:hypothetical protein